jgi:hypothetical protein
VTTTVRPPELTRALEELERAFPGRVTVEAEDASGAVVRIADIQLSARWSAPTGDLWFLIPFHYPDAAIYPYHVTGATPSAGHVQALQPVNWRGMNATQVSLRHNSWNPNVDTALGSVRQTLAWLQES